MRILWGWLIDPYVDLLLIGFMLVQLATAFGGDSEVEDRVPQSPHCSVCDCYHAKYQNCPNVRVASLSVTSSSVSVADTD